MAFVNRRRRKSDVNIVPLVDVLIVLIFFFLMTTQFSNTHVMNITPPKVETAGQNKVSDSIEIVIGEEGDFFYNRHRVETSALLDLIDTAASVSTEQRILIIADEDSALKHVTWVMDSCRKVGLEKLRLQTR